jgi:hypothetical protein
MVAHGCNSSSWKIKVEDCKFVISLGYIASSRPAWATKQDSVLKKIYKRKKFKRS